MPDSTRILTVAEAIREATDICLEQNPSVFVIGEGVTDPKAIFGTTRGLVEKYGPDRIIETPVSENGITGIAIGSALLGQRPLMIHQRVEFALLAFEQIVNNAAKICYVSEGRLKVPMVIRLIVGRGWGQGPYHAQSLEPLFAHIPGLRVIMPTTAYDAKGMLIAAVENDNPVICIEHRWLHQTRGEVPNGRYTIPLDQPRVARQGRDVTLVATSYMVLEAMVAADALARGDCNVEIIDLRALRPVNLSIIHDSVKRTGRLLCVDTGWRTYGVGAEIVAQITEACFDDLKAAPRRLGLPDRPAPSTRSLAETFYRTPADIIDAVAELTGIDGVTRAAAHAVLADRLKGRQVDVPDASFTGPF